MPPPHVKSIRQLIYWQYAKIITASSGFSKKEFGMVMSKCKKLESGEIHWSTSVREWLKEKEMADTCIYCGEQRDLTVEHILPRSCGGEDIPDNVVMVCKSCNSSKGGKRLYEWQGLKSKDQHHRIAEGKYLKYLYHRHEKQGTLDVSDVMEICGLCNMQTQCAADHSTEKLSVYCIEGCFHKK
jgi:HNH endonuclease